MIDAQVRDAPTSVDALIAGDEAEEQDRESEKKVKTATSECPFTGKSKGLTDDEVIDNAFLILLAG